MDSSREQFKTRLGFILIAAGCAVGIGNEAEDVAHEHEEDAEVEQRRG